MSEKNNKLAGSSACINPRLFAVNFQRFAGGGATADMRVSVRGAGARRRDEMGQMQRWREETGGRRKPSSTGFPSLRPLSPRGPPEARPASPGHWSTGWGKGLGRGGGGTLRGYQVGVLERPAFLCSLRLEASLSLCDVSPLICMSDWRETMFPSLLHHMLHVPV